MYWIFKRIEAYKLCYNVIVQTSYKMESDQKEFVNLDRTDIGSSY